MRAFQYVVSLVIAGAFLYWAFSGTDIRNLWSITRTISTTWIAYIAAITLLALLVRAWRWLILLRRVDGSATLWHSTQALLICYAANAVVPRSGEALRALSMRWSCGSSISSVIATVVVERVLDISWMFALIAASLALLPDQLPDAYPRWLSTVVLLAVVGCIALLVGLVWLSLQPRGLLNGVVGRLTFLPEGITDGMIRLADQFLQGLSALRESSSYLQLLTSSVLINGLYVYVVYLSFQAFGLDTQQGLDFSAALVVMAMSSAGMLFPTPAGVGSYHFFFAQSLHLFYGVPEETALACATVTHAIVTLTFLLVGSPLLLLQSIRRRRSDRVGPDKSQSAMNRD